jgi:hypothetical protein
MQRYTRFSFACCSVSIPIVLDDDDDDNGKAPQDTHHHHHHHHHHQQQQHTTLFSPFLESPIFPAPSPIAPALFTPASAFPTLTHSPFKTSVKQRLLEDATRLARAQVFAEFHQKVSKDQERARSAEERVRALEKENAALLEENRGLKQRVGGAKSSKLLLQPTDAAERTLLQQRLSAHDSDVILDTMICGSSSKIYVLNLVCVRSGEWLNSETINVYVLMVEAAAKQAGQNVTSFNSYLVSKLETDVSWEV